ncbi:hypothetical protein [Clostridium sp.]|uniref:hypothetical protein n=1 Tax=Clostridium sp. TaxID=1506 RepID=UPI001A4E9A9A|nr:hypothetical protein [Clostridium sp.]MBK5239800.1 hypothetical protein [Clostridium sp.]
MAILKFENGTISEKEGKLFVSENIEGELVERNLSEELSLCLNVPGLNLKVTKFKEPVERKPIAKYICGCGNKITSADEELEIKCLKCGQEFKIKE